MNARIFQHENEHMNGYVFTDLVSKMKLERGKKAQAKLIKQTIRRQQQRLYNEVQEKDENTENKKLDVSNLDFKEGVNSIKIFAASDEVLKPFEYSKSFIVLKENNDIPQSEILESSRIVENNEWYVLFILPIIVGIIIFGIRKSRLSANNK